MTKININKFHINSQQSYGEGSNTAGGNVPESLTIGLLRGNRKEVWKAVKGYEDHYEISNLGRVRSLDRVVFRNDKGTGGEIKMKGIIRKLTSTKKGYHSLVLTKNKISRTISLHVLVANNFIKNPYNKDQINHINGLKTDNRIENLEWCTSQENVDHAYQNGLRKRGQHVGTKNSRCKITEKQVIKIRSLKGKMLQKDIAKKFNICQVTVSAILSKKLWEHI
jgi:hypothetical protein